MRTIIILIYFGLSNSLIAQELIKKGSINNTTQVFFFQINKVSLPNSLSDTLKNFYIKDYDKINILNRYFTLTEIDEEIFCGFDYAVYQTDKGNVVRKALLNLSCSYALIDGSPYKLSIDSNVIIPKEGAAFIDVLSFNDLISARTTLDKVLSDTCVFLVSDKNPKWKEFEGYFLVKTSLDYDDFKRSVELFTKKYFIRTEINLDEIKLYTVYSDFNFYRFFKHFGKGDWKPYDKVGFELISIYSDKIKKLK